MKKNIPKRNDPSLGNFNILFMSRSFYIVKKDTCLNVLSNGLSFIMCAIRLRKTGFELKKFPLRRYGWLLPL